MRNLLKLKTLAASLLILSACSTKAPVVERPPVVKPERSEALPVLFFECDNDQYACLTVDHFENLLINENNDEIYIEQLENLLEALSEDVK